MDNIELVCLQTHSRREVCRVLGAVQSVTRGRVDGHEGLPGGAGDPARSGNQETHGGSQHEPQQQKKK